MIHIKYKNQVIKDKFRQGAVRAVDSLFSSCHKNVSPLLTLVEENNQSHQMALSENLSHSISEKYQTLFVLGMGGASAGTRIINQIFGPLHSHRKIYIIDTLDPRAVQILLGKIKELSGRCAWLVVSKSGETLETRTLLQQVEAFYQKNQWPFYDGVWVLTQKKESCLWNWAKEKQVPVHFVLDRISGRFSTFTANTLVPAFFLDLNVREFLEGARQMLQQRDLLGELVAQSLFSFAEERWTTFFWCQSSFLTSFGHWWQQVWSESLGKDIHQRVSIPFWAEGPKDQHSLLQHLATDNVQKMLFALEIAENQSHSSSSSLGKIQPTKGEIPFYGLGAVYKAQMSALIESLDKEGMPILFLSCKDLSFKSVGGLLMLTQLWVIALAEALQVNAFDQPQVEAIKKRCLCILESYSANP